MAKPQLVLSQENAQHVEVFKQYSLMTGIPLDDLLDECLSEYIEVTIETGYEDLAERAASA